MTKLVYAPPRSAAAVVAGLSVVLVALAVPAEARSRTLDLLAPSVVISQPSVAATTAGRVLVAGSATDNTKLKRLEVGVDDGNYKRVKVRRSAWSTWIDTTAYPDGVHDVTVRAWDRAANLATAAVAVVVDNEPDVGTAPMDGSDGGSDPAPTDPPPSDPPPSGSMEMTTPEGTEISVASAGSWTAEQVYGLLKEAGLDSTMGPHLTVKVQDTYPSQTLTSAGTSGGRYAYFSAVIYLKGVSSTFVNKPNDVVTHEVGHVWSLYHLYLSQQADWSSYLEARGLAGNPKLDSTYNWSKLEIIADDYRLLFGSELAISQRPSHLNWEIPDPREVPGLREFFVGTWAVPKP